MQACLREIHTSLLRKYLQRLEQVADDEHHLEAHEDIRPEVEDVMHDTEGIIFF